jgi:hypothetical protein
MKSVPSAVTDGLKMQIRLFTLLDRSAGSVFCNLMSPAGLE